MSKWLEQFNEVNRYRINKRIEKLKEEYDYYMHEYIDYPYDRYEKAKQRRKEEIEELEKFADPEGAKREIEDWKEETERLRQMLGRIGYLAANIEPCDQKSYANLQRLIGMTSSYSCTDEQFKAQAEAGIW